MTSSKCAAVVDVKMLCCCCCWLLVASLHHVTSSSSPAAAPSGGNREPDRSSSRVLSGAPAADPVLIGRQVRQLRRRFDELVDWLRPLAAVVEFDDYQPEPEMEDDRSSVSRRAITFGRRLELPVAAASDGGPVAATPFGARRETLGPFIKAMRYGRRR